jgi:DNA polymerase III sliding clamp (beta) subunit (PCNA family)
MNTVKETLKDTATIQLGQALELLEGALTHASKDTGLPVLNAVRVEAGEGQLSAIGCDRYRLIQGKVEGEGELSVSLISMADIKRIITLLKGEGKGMDTLPVSLSRLGDMLTVSVNGNAVTLNLVRGDYPPTSQFLAEGEGEYPMPHIAFNPGFMADYAKIAGRGAKGFIGVRLAFQGEKKPIRVIFAGNSARKVEWKAIIMPMSWTD